MRRGFLILLTLSLAPLALTAASFTPTCAVQVTSTTQRFLPGRLVRVQADAGCPVNGRAYVRFRSQTGTQPDAPPGYFPLARGEYLTRRVPRDWWVEARDKALRWTRQTEAHP